MTMKASEKHAQLKNTVKISVFVDFDWLKLDEYNKHNKEIMNKIKVATRVAETKASPAPAQQNIQKTSKVLSRW